MCGIYGCLLKGEMPPGGSLADAQRLLHHRGPNEHGLFAEGSAALGHTRLSIIDLSSGQQPMHSADGRFVIVFNGEIYNFQELRDQCSAAGYAFRTRSDTEVILALYARHGEACLKSLRGMFAFAIYDRTERTLFVARDRLGVKPLLYGESPRGFFFASEMPALLALDPKLRDELDWTALVDYFARQYILAPQTPYLRVRKLEPGCCLLVNKNAAVNGPRRYWFPETIAPRVRSEAEAEEELKERFTTATRLRLISDVPLGAFLSGGIDSSITVAVMAQLLGKPFKTYCIGFDDQDYDESAHARRVAQHCGTDHEELVLEYNTELPALVSRMVRHFGEPFADSSMIPTYYVAQLARRGLTVVLSGDGADEIWGGYKRHYQVALWSQLKRLHLAGAFLGARRLTTALESLKGPKKSFPVNQLDRLLLADKPAAELLSCKCNAADRDALFALPELRAASREYSFLRPFPENPAWDDLERFLCYDMRTFLSGDVLPKVDIATMMNSIEARSPFLDHELIEFAFSLPRGLRRRNLKNGKYLLKKTFANLLPPGHFDRPKMGFSPPLGQWLRTLLREWAGDRLSGAVCRRWLNQKFLLRLFTEHQNGREHGRTLWLAAVFCEWAEQLESNRTDA